MYSSSSGSSTPTYKWDSEEEEWGELKKSVLDNINEFNKKQASEGKKKFVTESDIKQSWLSGTPHKEFDLEISDDDDSDNEIEEFYLMKGSGRKRVLDEEDYYPFPAFNKKWVKVE